MEGQESSAGGEAALGLRERKKRATRTALAEAAIRLAAEHGAENVTVDAISSVVGVSPRTFFNYFDTRDEAFVVLDPDAGERLAAAVTGAPAALPVLTAVRRALAAELAGGFAERHAELWQLRAKVFQESPHLLAHGLGVHMADERRLASAIARRLAARGQQPQPPAPEQAQDPPGLYPRLLAAVAMAATRVAVEQWSADGGTAPFAPFLARSFDHLAAGLSDPAGHDSAAAGGTSR